MGLKFNPFTKKLDYFLHNSIASYRFLGWTTDDPEVDPGKGNVVHNAIIFEEEEYEQLVFNRMDLNRYDTMWFATLAAMFAGGIDFWIFLHSKRNPNLWMGGPIYGTDSLLVGAEEEEREVGYIFYWFAVMGTTTYDEEEDEYGSELIPDNTEVLISMYPAPAIFGGDGGGPGGE